jgi:hypothetical protein
VETRILASALSVRATFVPLVRKASSSNTWPLAGLSLGEPQAKSLKSVLSRAEISRRADATRARIGEHIRESEASWFFRPIRKSRSKAST